MGKIAVAVDVGAGSVKILAAEYDGGRVASVDSCEFGDEPIGILGSLYIDIQGIYKGIVKFLSESDFGGKNCASLGIDTYGNGYGILDAKGRLMAMPLHYRDERTAGILGKMAFVLPMEEIYRRTGIYPLESRVLMQLYREALEDSAAMREGATFLPLANLLTYFLSGEKAAERTSASVACLLEPGAGGWNHSLMERLSIPARIFPGLRDCGSLSGRMRDIRVGKCRDAAVIDVVGHDTESALATLPARMDSTLFASLGTSIVFGARTEGPVVNSDGFGFRFKNVAGAFGANSLCRDFPGFWIVNKCLESMRRRGESCRHSDLGTILATDRGNASYLDLGDPVFGRDTPDMPKTIQDYCRRTGQAAPDSSGEIVRCVFESMALQMKWSFECLKKVSGRRDFRALYAVNGGTKSDALLQMMADALDLPVMAGSPVASALGNILMQLHATGDLASQDEIAAVSGNSCGFRGFAGRKSGKWDEALAWMAGMHETQ